MNFSLLTRLTETPGISGREERVREVVAERFSHLSAEISVDAMGNLIGHIPGKGPRVALVAHMDEIGFMVSKVEPDGFIRVMPVGGVDQQVFWAQKVIVHGRKALPGVVGSVPPHLLKKAEGQKDKKPLSIDEGFIDLGLPPEMVLDLVKIGDPVTFATRSWENETSFFAKALDDRVGLFVMLESVKSSKNLDCDLFLIASTQEEVGLRGAGPAVYSVGPQIAIALEGTVASDTPNLKLPSNAVPTIQGKGPEIRLMDKRMISNRQLADFLVRLAKEAGLIHQVVVKNTGSTDAAAGQISGAGVKACVVSVPTRYIHAPMSVARKADISQAVALIAAFLEQASGLALTGSSFLTKI
jgi:putative aminopeptidase FrvX